MLTRALLFCLISVLGLLASSCGQLQAQNKPVLINSGGKVMPPDAAPLDRQIYRIITAEPKTLDLTIDAYSAGAVSFLLEPLVVLDASQNLKPGAAEWWESTPDGRQWTFHLRHGNRWSDGHPVTAHDFEYSFKRLLDPDERSNYAFVYYDIKGARDFNGRKSNDRDTVGVRAVDDYTLVIETIKPTPYMPALLAFVTSIPVPRWQVEKYGQRWTQSPHFVASGPYQLKEWVPGRDMTFTINPYYKGPNRGYLEQIRWIFSANPSAHLSAYENDEIDFHSLSPIELPRVEQDPRLSRDLRRTHAYMTWYLFFKTQVPPFHDKRVRQAIAHAIDREIICRVVLKGTGIPAYTMLPPGVPGHLGNKYRELQIYNPALARKLLAEAGYPQGRKFPRMDLWLRSANTTEQQVAQAIQAMLKDNLGIQVNLKNQEATVYFDNMYRYQIPFSLVPFNQDYADPSNMLTMVWHSREVGFGRHDWTNPEFDRLVDLAGVEMNPTRRMELYEEAQRVLSEDAGGVFIFYPVSLQLVKPWVKNFNAGTWPDYPDFQKGNPIWDIYIGR